MSVRTALRELRIEKYLDRTIIEAANVDIVNLTLNEMLDSLRAEIESQPVQWPKRGVDCHLKWLAPNPDADKKGEGPYISVEEDDPSWTLLELSAQCWCKPKVEAK